MAATIVQSGSYDLQIATGFLVDAFTLDDPVKGVLDNTEYVLDGTTEFASVIDGATGISVFRGRRDIGDQFTAGTMSFDLNDTFTGGILNPFDTKSPYYDTDQAVPGLAPMRKVVLSREGENCLTATSLTTRTTLISAALTPFLSLAQMTFICSARPTWTSLMSAKN
jgi:hypothetical protein